MERGLHPTQMPGTSARGISVIVELAGIRELFESIFSNRFQHAESWQSAGDMGWDYKRAVHQRGNEVEDLIVWHTPAVDPGVSAASSVKPPTNGESHRSRVCSSGASKP